MNRWQSLRLTRNQWLTLLATSVLLLAALLVMHHLTARRIAHNDRAWLAAQLQALVPDTLHDNDLLDDVRWVSAPDALGTRQPQPIYRARLQGAARAVVIRAVAPDGYGGPIDLLVGIKRDGTLLGVRILAHQETPGMGNDFELPGNDWLSHFRGRSLNDPTAAGWNVQKDGGQFAQFTSATITPRAIVKAVARVLDYYRQHADEVYQ